MATIKVLQLIAAIYLFAMVVYVVGGKGSVNWQRAFGLERPAIERKLFWGAGVALLFLVIVRLWQ